MPIWSSGGLATVVREHGFGFGRMRLGDLERVDGDQCPGARSFDVALAEVGREALQELGLLLDALDLALRRRLLQPQQPLVPGEQAVALPPRARPRAWMVLANSS